MRARRLAARIGVGLQRASSGSLAALGEMGGVLSRPERTERGEDSIPEEARPLRS